MEALQCQPRPDICGMSACAGQDLIIKTVSGRICADFDKRVESIPAAMCAPFREEAGKLVSELKTVSSFAAEFAKAEDDLDKVAKIWGEMVAACDQCLRRMSALCKAHPHCDAEIYHDQILDFRNRCGRLHEIHA